MSIRWNPFVRFLSITLLVFLTISTWRWMSIRQNEHNMGNSFLQTPCPPVSDSFTFKSCTLSLEIAWEIMRFLWKVELFPITTANVLRDRYRKKTAQMVPIKVHEVNAFNVHFLPTFERVGFEFFSLSQSRCFVNGQVSQNDFYSMLHRVASVTSEGHQQSAITMNDEPILVQIVDDFNDRHRLNMKVTSTRIFSRNGGGSPIHFDGKGAYDVRIWIPLTCTVIDNLCLGMGDVELLRNSKCADPTMMRLTSCKDGRDFENVVWYQRMKMSSEDWVIFRGDRVPHYAVNVGNAQVTQRRSALVINLKSLRN